MSEAEEQPAAASAKSPRRWRKTKIALVVFALLVLGARFGGVAAIPGILDGALREHGYAATIGELELSVTTGQLDLWNLELRDLDATDDAVPLVQLEYITLDVDVSALATGDLVVHRAELDGLDVHIERASDGEWNFASLLDGLAGEPVDSVDETEPADQAEPQPISLNSPILLAALRAQHVFVHFKDAAVEPPFESRLRLSLRGSNLGSIDRVGRLEADLALDGVVDAIRCDGRLSLSAEELSFEGELVGDGIRPGHVRCYLEPLGVRSSARALSLGGRVTARAAVVGPEKRSLEFDFELADMALAADGEEALALDRLAIDVAELNDQAIRVSDVSLSGGRAGATLLESGQLAFAGLEIGSPTADAPERKGTSAEADDVQAAPSANAGNESAHAWAIDRVHLADFDFGFRDETHEAPCDLTFRLDELEWIDIGAPTESQLTLLASSPGLFDSIEVRGVAELVNENSTVDLACVVDPIRSSAIEPYLDRVGVSFALESGRLEGRLKSDVRRSDDGLEGTIALESVRFLDGEERWGLDRCDVTDFAFRSDGTFDVGRVELVNARALVPLDGQELPIHANGSVVALNEFEFDLSAPSVIESLETKGTLAIEGEQVQIELGVDGAGVSTERFASLLADSGVEWTLSDGTLSAALRADVRQVEGGVDASLLLRDAELAQGGNRIVGVDRVELRELRQRGEAIEIEAIEIDGPSADAARDANGLLSICGLELLPPPPDDTPPTGNAAPAMDESQEGVAPSPTELPELRVNKFQLTGARVGWSDAFVEPPVAIELVSGFELLGLDLGSKTPAELSANLRVDGALDAFSLTGALVPSIEELTWTAALRANGMRAGPLAAYLPPGMTVEFEDGRFQADLELASAQLEAGGRSAKLLVKDVQLSEGDAGRLLALDRCGVEASRLDFQGDVLAIDTIEATGIELGVELRAGDVVSALGLAIAPQVSPPAMDAEQAEPAVETADPRQPGEEEAQPVIASADVADAEEAESRKVSAAPSWVRRYDEAPLPRVTLGRVDLDLSRFEFLDRRVDASVPLVASLRFQNREPLVLLDQEPDELPPFQFDLTGRVDPIVDEIEGGLSIEPWDEEATLRATLAVRGIQGAGLIEVMPDLASTLDPSGLEAGEFSTSLEARLLARRRNPLDFDLRHGFGAVLLVNDVALRHGAEQITAFGFESLEASIKRVSPASGDVHVEFVELRNLVGRAGRSSDGLEFAGVVLRAPSEEGAVVNAEPEPSADGAANESSGEIKLDELLISGLDFEFVDRSVEPPMILPLDFLDVELKRFTTRTLTQGDPFRFSAFVGAGDVELPKRKQATSALAGLAGAAVSALTGSDDVHDMEERPLFGELALAGQLGLGDAPEGWLRFDMSSLELLEFAALAKDAGVDIGSGVMDAYAQVRLRGERGMTVDSRVEFNDLSLDEPPGGPISTYLKLPAPLDSVLFVLEDQDGAHVIPVSFSMGSDGISTAEIASVAVRTLGEVIARALANAPLRVTGAVTGILGLTGTEEDPGVLSRLTQPVLRLIGLGAPEGPKAAPVEVGFEPAQTTLTRDHQAQLRELVEELGEKDHLIVRVHHAFSSDDVRRAAELANPSREACLDLVEQLRRRKAQLSRSRSELAAETLSTFVVKGGEEASGSIERLRELDRRIGETEYALDDVFDLLRPGAERYADKRTRRACARIAEARTEELREWIASRLGDSFDLERIQVQKPRLDQVREAGPAVLTVELQERAAQ